MRVNLLTLGIIGGVLVGLAGLGVSARADESRSGPSSIDACAFIEGRWISDPRDGSNIVEESWSAPSGGAIMGMFRMIADGKPRFYEFLLIEQRDSGVELRLHHFSPGMSRWEDEPLVWRLAECEPDRAAFKRVDEGGAGWIVYERQGDRLTATLDDDLEAPGHQLQFTLTLQR